MSVLTTGDPNNLLTYTTPSTKWVRNSSGVYVSGTTLRTDYLATGTALGLLIEGQKTNVILRSQEFDNASWTKTDVTVTANAATSPDGTATADLLTEGTAGTALTAQTGTATTASAAVSGSIFLRASANNTWAKVTLTDSVGTTGVDAWVNLSSGAIGTVTAKGTATSTGGRSVQSANGFWRVELWATFQPGVSDARLIVQSASADNSNTRVNNAAYYAWQAQAELGVRPSSLIVTTSAAVTRASDAITILTSLLPFSATVGTLIGKVRPFGTVSQFLAEFDNNSSNNRLGMRVATDQGAAFISDGGVTQSTTAGGATATLTVSKIAMAWAANDIAISVNGAAVQTDNAATIPTVDRLRLGSSVASSYLDGHLQSLTYLPRRASNSELQAFST